MPPSLLVGLKRAKERPNVSPMHPNALRYDQRTPTFSEHPAARALIPEKDMNSAATGGSASRKTSKDIPSAFDPELSGGNTSVLAMSKRNAKDIARYFFDEGEGLKILNRKEKSVATPSDTTK